MTVEMPLVKLIYQKDLAGRVCRTLLILSITCLLLMDHTLTILSRISIGLFR